MKVPEMLKIGGHLYRVVRAEMPDKNSAETDRGKRLIKIDAELEGSSLDSTLIHEIFHVMNGELEHCLLDSLAEQIYQVLCDNGFLR